MDLADARLETFEAHLDTTFQLGPHAFHLRQVKALGAPAVARAPFSLLFDGPEGLQQGIAALEHPALGAVQLFLVPIGPGRYEAVFT